MPTLSTDQSYQTVHQSGEIYNGSIEPFQVICADHFRKIRKDTVYTGSDMCVLTLDRFFPTKTAPAEESARCIHQ